ncbi:MAG TPA: DoxX family protein, partial [Rhizobiaceae bacterium]|nr:DoxX family protein [Rhizobiaceae bacterium]
MNILLWVLQILLALHTVTGAVWKFFNPAQAAVPSLAAIPPSAWLGLSVIEILCAIGLVFPFFYKPLGYLAPIAAIVIAT